MRRRAGRSKSRRATEGLPDPQDPEDFQRYWVYHYRDKLPPPTREEVLVPFASMDIMAYSYDGRATLAKIAARTRQRQGGVLAASRPKKSGSG